MHPGRVEHASRAGRLLASALVLATACACLFLTLAPISGAAMSGTSGMAGTSGMSDCDVCVDGGASTCAVGLALLALTVLGLLRGTLRDTFLGTEQRGRPRGARIAGRRRHGYARTSPYVLCVLRT